MYVASPYLPLIATVYVICVVSKDTSMSTEFEECELTLMTFLWCVTNSHGKMDVKTVLCLDNHII